MYQYVESNEVKRYRSFCSKVLEDVRDDLFDSFGINTNFSLVGSGGDARNMVTRNGDAPFDLDYNLYIISMPDEYWNDLRKLKETVRCSLNKAVGNSFFSDGKDSTSVITSILHFNDSPKVEFSFDVAILAKNSDGDYCRLIHNKNYGIYDQWTWCQVPSSKDVRDKAIAIKKNSLWDEVRATYLDKKNMYLYRGDKNHPSFMVYVESVNEIYNKYFD